MKGVVFTEYLDFAEQKFGLEVSDEMIESSDLSNAGAYTAVGTYDHQELVSMVLQLQRLTGTPVNKLLFQFGEYLFHSLARAYPDLVAVANCSFELLERIDGYIHVEVKKLYPEAEIPKFNHERVDNDHLLLLYESDKGLGDLAEGLLQGCFSHFNEKVTVKRIDEPGSDGKRVRFELERGS